MEARPKRHSVPRSKDTNVTNRIGRSISYGTSPSMEKKHLHRKILDRADYFEGILYS